ncbi:MAG: glycine betaine/L-proline ABC transporter ATP-binding protein [Caldilineaceae bacterium]
MMKAGASKDEVLAETGHVIGVNNVSFDVEEGEVFVVMGLSGSGKSTLIRCLNRLHEPTDGHIYLDGEDILKANKQQLEQIRRTKMAMVFQHFGLFPHRTVGDNVAYGLKVRGMSPEERRQKAEEALALVGLAEWIDHYPDNLSGGMQQRVGLARALATDADILLMDEAFSALDPLIRRQMQDELMQLQERLHKTIIFITHDLNEALRIGNRVAVMRDGEIVQIGTPTEIITQPSEEYVAKFMADVDQSRCSAPNL